MECTFGACPADFVSTLLTQSREEICVGDELCYSKCGKNDLKCGFNGRFAEIEQRDFSQWMAHFHKKPLNKLFVVGAHHSLAQLDQLDFNLMAETSCFYDILRKLESLSFRLPRKIQSLAAEHLLPMFACTQISSPKTLLKHGVRLLDIRPYHFTGTEDKPEGLYDYHGGQGPDIQESLSQVKAFLAENPSEVVYLLFQNLMKEKCLYCGKDVAQRVIDVVEDVFGKASCTEESYISCERNLTLPLKRFSGKVVIFSSDPTLIAIPYILPAHTGMEACPADMTVGLCARYYNKHSLGDMVDAIRNDRDTAEAIEKNSSVLRLYQVRLGIDC